MMPFRLPPAMPVGAYQTYQISAPLASHWRPASCADVDCEAYLRGWSTTVDEASELGQRQAHYIRRLSGRQFTEHRDDTGLTVFTFGPGQVCFRSGDHRTRIDRPEIFTVRGGDWRGTTGEIRRHTRPEFWVEDFAEHQQTLADAIERG